MSSHSFAFHLINNDLLVPGTVEELVNSAMAGFNTTIFAYGQTSSGKQPLLRSPDAPDVRTPTGWAAGVAGDGLGSCFAVHPRSAPGGGRPGGDGAAPHAVRVPCRRAPTERRALIGCCD